MSNEKLYRYFKMEGDAVEELMVEYTAIRQKRTNIITSALTSIGANDYTTRSFFGKTKISSFLFYEDKKFDIPVTILQKLDLDGIKCIQIKAKGNSKAAKDFNSKMDSLINESNELLKDAPTLKGFLMWRFNIYRKRVSEPQADGHISMLTTYCGTTPDNSNVLLFAIPANDEDNLPFPEVTAFDEISYGRFYDLSNGV